MLTKTTACNLNDHLYPKAKGHKAIAISIHSEPPGLDSKKPIEVTKYFS